MIYTVIKIIEDLDCIDTEEDCVIIIGEYEDIDLAIKAAKENNHPFSETQIYDEDNKVIHF